MLLIDLIKNTVNHMEQIDLTKPRENSRGFHSKAATGKLYFLYNQNPFGCGINPHLESVLGEDGEQAFE